MIMGETQPTSNRGMKMELAPLRRVLVRVIFPLSYLVGKVSFHPGPYKVTDSDYERFLKALRPGDVLISKTCGHLSNVFIAGKYKHCAIYIGEGLIVEAIGSGVRVNTLEDFMTTKDGVMALRPKFLNAEESQKVADVVLSVAQRPRDKRKYDYFFEGDGAFYCAELFVFALHAVLGAASLFTNRKVMGLVTTYPDDFRLAVEKMEPIAVAGA